MTSALNIASDQEFIETRADGVVTLTLNRPERLNALATSIMEGLLEALPRLEKDSDVGVIILTGAGRAFCSGGDVKSMAEGWSRRISKTPCSACAAGWKWRVCCMKSKSRPLPW